MSAPRYVIGVDVGGTFTDVFVWDEVGRQVTTAKVPSTRENQSKGFIEGIRQRVDNFLEALKCLFFAGNDFGKRLSIYHSALHCAGKGRADSADRCAAFGIEIAHGGVCVVNGKAEPRKHLRGFGFTHADRTGEADKKWFGGTLSQLIFLPERCEAQRSLWE